MNRSTRVFLLSCSCLGAVLTYTPAHALPEYESTTAGSVQLDNAGAGTLNIHQHTDKAIVRWNRFDIGHGETVNVLQPSSQSILLNRVLTTDPSKILGNLNANGHVWIMNPGGVLFGENAQVNVGGLLATTASINDSDFMAGHYRFNESGLPGAQIINKGTINADQGVVGLFASNVSNQGTINANFGKVVMAGTETFTVDFYGDGMLNFSLDDLNAGEAQENSYKVSNSGAVIADAGQIEMTVAQGNAVVERLIENKWTGTLQANSVGTDKHGKIVLGGGSGQRNNTTTLVSGRVKAKGLSSGEKGGKIDVLGDKIAVLDGGEIEVSGMAQGGIIHVGGEYLGGGTTPHAEMAVIQSGAALKANGGNGEVIVWSDDYTNFAGTIEADGGSGFVETSSMDILTATGNVYVSGGAWLLDPGNITVQTAGPTTVPGGPLFDAAGAGGIVTTASIQNALFGTDGTNGADVTIRTGTGGGGNGDIFINNNITYNGTAARSLVFEAYRNITAAADIKSTGGALGLTLNSRYSGGATGYVTISGDIDTAGGNLLMGGGAGAAGYAIAAAGQSGVFLANNSIDTGGGSLTMRGQASVGANNSGIYIGGVTIVTENGDMLIDGLGDYSGVIMEANTDISSAEGNITIKGKGTVGDTDYLGVILTDGSDIHSTTTTAGKGNIYIEGEGKGTGWSTVGITFNNGGAVATKGGNVELKGTATELSGIQFDGGSVTTEGDGTIKLTGSVIGPTGDVGWGVNMYNTSGLSSENGAITVTGTGGGAAVEGNYGISLYGPDVSVISKAGDITLTGDTLGGANYTTGLMLHESTVESETGDILITGSTKGTGTGNYGLYLENNIINSKGTDKATAGTITLRGYGSTLANGTDNSGIGFAGGQITSIAGNIQLTGDGGTGTNNNIGIDLANGLTKTTGTGVNAASIQLTGTSKNTTGSNNHGVQISAGGTPVQTGDGAITISGTASNNAAGNNNRGVYITNASTVLSSKGALTIEGKSTTAGAASDGIRIDGNSDVYTTGAGGDITITGESTNGIDLFTTGATVNIGTAATTGDITLNVNTISLANTSIDTTGTLTIKPRTAGQGIGIGGSTVGLDLSDAELGFISNNVTKVVIGDSVAGTGAVDLASWALAGKSFDVEVHGGSIDMSGALTFNQANDILLNARTGDITLDQLITKSGGGTSTLTAKAAGHINQTAHITSSSGALNVILWADAETVPNNSGHIHITNANITTLGGHVYMVGGLDDGANGGVVSDGIADGYAVGGAGERGIVLSNADISTGAGDIVLHAQGGSDAGGAELTSGSSLTVSDGDISILSIGGTGSVGEMSGFYIHGNSTITSTGTGAGAGTIYLSGTSGDDTDGDTYGGVVFRDGAYLASLDGDIHIVGSGGMAEGDNNTGIYLEQSGAATKIESTGDANIRLEGTATSSAAATDDLFGVIITGTSEVNSLGTGNIEIFGTGGSAGSGSSNMGVYLTGSVTSQSGSILIDGTAGAGTANINGLVTNGATITTTTGDITLTGSTTHNTSYGVFLAVDSDVQATAAGAGDIIINATSTNFTDFGTGFGATINIGSATSSKDITINADEVELADALIDTQGSVIFTPRTAGQGIGISGSTVGLDLSDAELGFISGNVTKVVIGNSAAGTGAVDITGWDFSGAGYDVEVHGGSIAASGITPGANDLLLNARTGDVTITQDTLNFTSATITAFDDIIIKPLTGTTAITIGTGAAGLAISAAELAFFNAGDTLVIGDSAAGTGAVTIDTVDITANGDKLEVYGGEITVDNGLTGAASILLTARNDEDIIVNSIITADGGGDSLILNATGDFMNTHGAGALEAGVGGRFLVYSADVATIDYGTLTGDIIYDETFATLAPAAVPAPNNTFIFAGADPSPPPPPPPDPTPPAPDPTPTPPPASDPVPVSPDILIDPPSTETDNGHTYTHIIPANYSQVDYGDDATGGLFSDLWEVTGTAYSYGNLADNTAVLFNQQGYNVVGAAYTPKVGDYIKTGDSFGFVFQSDENAIVKMTRNSSLKVKKVFFSPDGKNDEYYDVKGGAVGFFSDRDKHKGEIKTILPGIAIKVTGTCYIVDHNEASDQTNITLFGGGIELYVKGQLLKLKDPIQMISFGAEGPGASGPVVPKPLTMTDVRKMFQGKPEIIPSREELLKCGVPAQDI